MKMQILILLSLNIGLFVSASSLPSNALNRWTFVRGGETATATPPSSSSRNSGGKLIMEDNSSGNVKPKRKRKKRSSSSSSSAPNTAQASSSQSSPSPSKRGKTKSSSTKIQQKPSRKSSSSSPSPSTSQSQSTGEAKKSSQETNNDKPSSPSLSQSSQSPLPLLSSPIPSTTTSTSTSTASSSSSSSSTSTHDHDQMPSIFTPEEAIYDKYAACIAATEGLRRIRDSKLVSNKKRGFRSAVNVDADSSVVPWKSLLNLKGPSGVGAGSGTGIVQQDGAGGGSESNGTLSPEQQKELYKRACAEYVLNSTKVIKALGLSVSQFNQLGREIKKNGPLKEKVMEQAYLYRMASTIKMDKIPLIQDPNSKKLLRSHKRRRVQMFVKSITEIEELRSEQMERLKRALNIDKLPPHMNLCDPNVLPLLNPKVRAVIEAFPLQAEVIVKKYGLNSDEFNSMLEETRGNPIFRWRVQRFKKKSDDDNFGMGGGSMSSSGSRKSDSGVYEF